jgi:hypothetical protein
MAVNVYILRFAEHTGTAVHVVFLFDHRWHRCSDTLLFICWVLYPQTQHTHRLTVRQLTRNLSVAE